MIQGIGKNYRVEGTDGGSDGQIEVASQLPDGDSAEYSDSERVLWDLINKEAANQVDAATQRWVNRLAEKRMHETFIQNNSSLQGAIQMSRLMQSDAGSTDQDSYEAMKEAFVASKIAAADLDSSATNYQQRVQQIRDNAEQQVQRVHDDVFGRRNQQRVAYIDFQQLRQDITTINTEEQMELNDPNAELDAEEAEEVRRINEEARTQLYTRRG